jgi:methyl-accepting chemotaxis protein
MKFSSKKLGAKLAIGFSIILFLLIIITVLSLNRLSAINSEMNRIVTDDYRKVTISNNVIDQINIIAVATRNIAISRDQAFIQKEKERIDAARSKYAQGMEELRKTVKRPEGIANLAEIDKAIDQLKPLNIKTMELGAAMQTEEVAKLVAEQLEPGQAKLLGAIEAMIRYQEGKMAASVKEADQAYTLALIILIVFSLIAIITGSGIAYYLTRSITKPINHVITALSEAAQQVAAASGELSGTSQSLAEGTQEQASSIEETSSSLEEMSSMTKASADNANEANVIIMGSTKDMDSANQVMKDLITSMNEISAASENTQKIVKTIDEIAFQTNLLALNAAVEAARAGEAGAGFAVVADEVRNLAMRAAEAAKNTQGLIEGTVQKIHGGTELVQKTNEAFTKVAHDSVKIGQLINEIAAASKEQSQGVGQVNIAVSEVDKVVQQNAARAEESASASEELNAQAEQMKGFVQELNVLVNGMGSQVK